MKHWKIVLVISLIVVILLAGVYFVYVPNGSENNWEDKLEVDATAELENNGNWMFDVTFTLENKDNVTLNMLWWWLNATKVGYPNGTVEDLGITHNFTNDLPPYSFNLSPNILNTFSVDITQYGFVTEPSKLWVDTLIMIADQEPIPFNFHFSVEEGTVTKKLITAFPHFSPKFSRRPKT